MDKVQKDMLIGDVVARYPSAARVLANYGLHCVGCHVNPYETIEQGAKVHGMDERIIAQMMLEVNKLLTKKERAGNEKSPGSFTVTNTAFEKIKSLMKKEKLEEHFLRVQVIQGGCAGFSYQFYFDNKKQANDYQIEKDGIRVVVNEDSMKYMHGAKIDYIDTLNQSGFRVENPNAKSTCGCGSSVA